MAYVGISPRRFRSEGWAAIIAPGDLAAFRRALDDAASRDGSFEIDLRVRRFDGEYRWCQVRAAAVPSRSGAPASWLIWLVDVHRHREPSGSFRDAPLQRDERLVGFAHDIRNPLQTMRHALYALQLPVTGSVNPTLIRILERQVELLTQRTQQYLGEWDEAAEREGSASGQRALESLRVAANEE